MACIIVSSPGVGGDGGGMVGTAGGGMVGTIAGDATGNRGDSGDGVGCGCAAAATSAASGVSSFSEIEAGEEGRDKASCSSTRGVA